MQIAAVTLSVEGGEAQPWGAPQTRVSETEDGMGSKWDGDEEIGVQIEGSTETATYIVQADGTVSSDAPLYWQNDQSQGIGDDQTNNGQTTQVDGSTTWETAMNAMNEKLSGTGWQYVPGSGNEPMEGAFANVQTWQRQCPDMRKRAEIAGYAYRFRTNWQNLPDADRQQTIPSIYLLFSGGAFTKSSPF